MKGLIFTYALTIGGAAIAPFYPFYAFLVYVAFASLKPEYLWSWSVPEGNYSRIVAAAFLVGWLLNGAGTWRRSAATPILVALMVYWGWLVVGAVLSPAQQDAYYTLEVLSKVFLPLLAGFTLLHSLERLKQLAWVLVLSYGVLAVQFNQQYYSWGIDIDSWEFAGSDNNSIAITMVTACGLAFTLGLASQSWWQKAIAFGLAALMAHVVLFSMSRGGMLAMVLSALTAFLLLPKRPVSYAALAGAVVLVLMLAGNEVRQEFWSSFAESEKLDSSALSRYKFTRDAAHCMLTNPIFGCGMENWVNVAPEYGWPQGRRAHNTWMEIGATLGILGLASILAFYGICCWQMTRLARVRSVELNPWYTWMSRGVVISLVGFFGSACFVTSDRIELPYYIVLLGAGMLRVLAAEGVWGTLFARGRQTTIHPSDAPALGHAQLA